MVATLPHTISLKLRQTLAQWRHWHCDPPLPHAPEVVAHLTAGLSNYSVLVAAGQQFVVRIDGINPANNGLSRHGEWRALGAAHRAGLSPCPRYFNPELGTLVCDFLAPDKQQPLRVADIGELLRGIHRLPARHQRLDLAERILRYEKQLQHRGDTLSAALMPARNQVIELLQDETGGDEGAVLCHNDLLRANRIYSAGKLWALDWEYCAMASPWYDLAVVVAGDTFTRAQTAELLQVYLGRAANATEWRRLQRHGCIYRYLELLWYVAAGQLAPGSTQVEAKTSALQDSLAQYDH